MSPGDIVPLSFDAGLVGLSYLIASAGSYAALLCAGRIRSIDKGPARSAYIGLAAIGLGGIGIWSMHFIGMQAQRFPFALGFAFFLTWLSMAVAIIFSGVAFWFVSRASFSSFNCIVGGLILGSGVTAMHYIGVFAMKIPAEITWNYALVALSVLIAVGASAAALWLAFNVESEKQRIFAALIMGGAICGMHYVGTAAGTVICTTPSPESIGGIGGMSLPYITFLLSAVVLIAMQWQLRRTSIQYRDALAARMDTLIKPKGKSVV